ncbi:serine/threonine-protein kinase [Streptomyces sp. NP160]|uniref:serine/threonine-protein kinase n=1 Tax=Streptomyces sp. NP160 TaxID=2586637 RepID=UPI001C57A55B|nr:serine/threonine-protein kinase [Streptomyces sp. NP160]
MDIGQQFGGYRIEARVGRGGMGVVYEAYDTVRERRVALKVLSPELADDEGYRARFLHEARTVAGLSSPHVVPVHDFGVVDGRLFLDMALIDGKDLAALLAAGPVSAARAVGIVEQVADALEVAHERGLVHRDVKAANVLVVRRRADQPDFVYLSDFGLARSTSPAAGAAGLTAVGTVVGTAECMSPEQIEGRPVDARSDVYALGCLLFHCLTGAAPFTTTRDGRPASAISVLDAHRAAPVPLLPPGGPWGSLDLVLATAMAKDPAHRYASAAALARAAREALSGSPVSSPVSARAAAPVFAHAAAGAPAPGAPAAGAGSAPGVDTAETMAAPARTVPATTAAGTAAGAAGGAFGPAYGGPAPLAAAAGAPPVPPAPTPPQPGPAIPQPGGHTVQPAPQGRRGLGPGAVVGIVGGGLALLGLVAAGGLLAAGALSDDEPAAASSRTPEPAASAPASPSSSPSSSSSASPSTPATPAPPAMVPNPALGATTTTAMDQWHQALLAALPRELNDCQPIDRDEVGGIAATAAVSCLGTNLPGGEVYAMSYPDEATRDRAFNAWAGMDTNTNGECPNNSGAGPWKTPSGAVGGTAACYQVFDDPEDPDSTSHAVMAWTVAGQPVFLTAFDPYSSLVPPLLQWQQAHAADYATTVPATAAPSAAASEV